MRTSCFAICSLAALLFAATSCNKSRKGVVLIDPDQSVPVVLEDVACDFKVIPLKSDGPIPASTFFYFFDDYFFTTDLDVSYTFTKVSVFDRQGNYLGTIDKHGRGRNEYLQLVNYVYHADSQQLYLYDMGPDNFSQSTVFKFQLPQLEFLGTHYPETMLSTNQIIHLGDGRSLMSAGADNNTCNLRIVQFLPDTVIGHKEYGEFGWNMISPTFYKVQFTNKSNPLVATFGYENNIYSFDDSDSLKPEFSFTFGLKGLPESYASQQNVLGPYLSVISHELAEYMQDGSAIIYDAPVKNGNLLSFMYYWDDVFGSSEGFRHFYLTDGRKSADYSELKIPGLKFNSRPRLEGVNGTSYVFLIEDAQVDASAPMSPLGQQIIDALRSQNDNNPILLQFRFKEL